MYYGEIDKWVHDYKVRGFKWIDNKNYYLHIEYYKPGQSLASPPAVEKSALIPLDEWEKKSTFLDSIVVGIMAK